MSKSKLLDVYGVLSLRVTTEVTLILQQQTDRSIVEEERGRRREKEW